MAPTETQLGTWSHQGAVVTAQNTHLSVRNALAAYPQLEGKDFDVYLQGSYKNSTNIFADSDVDIAIQNGIFFYDISSLSQNQQLLFNQAYQNTESTYTYWNFRKDVLQALQNYYGAERYCRQQIS